MRHIKLIRIRVVHSKLVTFQLVQLLDEGLVGSSRECCFLIQDAQNAEWLEKLRGGYFRGSVVSQPKALLADRHTSADGMHGEQPKQFLLRFASS